MNTLYELVEKYKSISIIGMCKNAGKTTVLNYLIRNYSPNKSLGLTSVGRDGESTDLVTNTAKPEIYLYKNTLAATASAFLSNCTVSPEILLSSGIQTPLGEVIVFKAKHGGFAEIAGPSSVQGLSVIRDVLFSFGAEKVIIDGAINRKSLGSPKVSEAIIFSIGAAYCRDINVVIRDACYACEIFLLSESVEISSNITGFNTNQAFDKNGMPISFKQWNWKDIIENGDVQYIYLSGALTDTALLSLTEFNIAGKTFVIEDSSKMLASQEVFGILRRKQSQLKVIKPVTLAAATINPLSPYGYSFNETEFIEKMQEALPVPVFDVMK